MHSTQRRYKVAENTFTVAVPEELSAWKDIEWHFSPFAVSPSEVTDEPELEVEIKSGRLPEDKGETIYEPVHEKIWIISSRTFRMADGSIGMEYWHVAEDRPRVWMKMSKEMNRAEIIISPKGDINDGIFLTHALMIAYTLATCGNGTLMIHSSSVIYEGRAYLFQGRSGTGKSTHASLWMKNIDGVELLNDDNPVIRFTADGEAMAYGSPWSGKTHCYRNEWAPIGAFVRIIRAEENELRRLGPLAAYASLTTSVSLVPFADEKIQAVRHETLERLVTGVPCCEMHCRPDAEAAFRCMEGLSELKNK